MFSQYSFTGSKIFSDIKFVLALFAIAMKRENYKMTITIPPPVEFGYFFGICKKLWEIYQSFENGDLNEFNFLHLKEVMINNLYTEYKKFNHSIEEFYYCVGGIELNDNLLNPLEFELKQFAYKVHVENCYKLSFNDGQ